jgi:hypothetical protein
MNRVWFSRRAIGLHVVIALIVPTFAALCDWQVHRALAGNELSWAYVFEWPFFAGYAVYMWWRFVHEEPDGATPTGATLTATAAAAQPAQPGQPARSVEAGPGDDPDAEDLAAYNDYLARLAAHDKRARPE